MLQNPMVSVRIPAYNHEKYIHACISSILNQTFQDFEIVIVDDGSKDGTVDVIRQFDDPRIKLEVLEKNGGMNVAVEHCMRRCAGQYIANMCSDDVWMPTKLEKQVAYLQQHPEVDAVFTRVLLIGENGEERNAANEPNAHIFDCQNREPQQWLRHFFYHGNCLCNPSVLIRRQVYEKFHYQDKRFLSLSDFDLWVRFSFSHRLWILDEKLTCFRIRNHYQNVSAATPANLNRLAFEYKQILDHYLQMQSPEVLTQIFPEALAYGKPTAETIPYFLGRLAVDTGTPYHTLWGLEKIYALLGNESASAYLAEACGFRYVDFIQMTAKANVFYHGNRAPLWEKGKARLRRVRRIAMRLKRSAQ